MSNYVFIGIFVLLMLIFIAINAYLINQIMKNLISLSSQEDKHTPDNNQQERLPLLEESELSLLRYHVLMGYVAKINRIVFYQSAHDSLARLYQIQKSAREGTTRCAPYIVKLLDCYIDAILEWQQKENR